MVTRGFNGDRELLASLTAGGSPERPIKVGSASVVEVRTAALACPPVEVTASRSMSRLRRGCAVSM